MKNMLKAILFDLDGVLVDAVDLHEKAFLEALGAYGYHITEEDHSNNLNGLPTKTKIKALRVPEEIRHLIAEEKARLTNIMIDDIIKPSEEKKEMMEYLRSKSVKIACCSNATTSSVVKMLKNADIHQYFDLILGNTDVENPKPDPEIYLKAMDILGVKQNEVIIFEDSDKGIEAGNRSGARCVKTDYSKVNKNLIRLYI